jgi:muconate cycloisomerase
VEIIADQGIIVGYGEGAPRTYVTGESQKSAAKRVAEFAERRAFPWNLTDVSQIWDFVDSISNGKGRNTAICGLEMALLDGLAKEQDQSVLEFFSKDFFAERVWYGASIPLGSKNGIKGICSLIRSLRIDKLRLKMGRDFENNQETIQLVRAYFGDGCDLRVDANGAWDQALAMKHANLIRECEVRVVEQPMMPGDPGITDFAEAMKADGITLMADESARSLAEVEALLEQGCYGMVNVRLSKCGGFRNSLKIIELLRQNQKAFQVGCQLGESGVLSAAGRALGLLCGDAAYYDGSYDKYLLLDNVTREDVCFGPGGEAGPLEGPGLGVTVSREKLERLSDAASRITIKRP